MSSLKYVLCAALLASLAACSSHPAPQQDAAAGANPAKSSTAIPASNPLAPMLNTRNRAKAVEKDLQAHDAAERKALKDAQQ